MTLWMRPRAHPYVHTAASREVIGISNRLQESQAASPSETSSGSRTTIRDGSVQEDCTAPGESIPTKINRWPMCSCSARNAGTARTTAGPPGDVDGVATDVAGGPGHGPHDFA